MAAFDEVQFPTRIAAGATGGPEFRTRIITLGSGYERRNQDWPTARARYNIGTGLRSRSDYAEIISFHRARRGMARGFRFKDWSDYQVTTQQFGTGNGVTLAFQLIKAYTDGVITVNRDITKPVSGTVHIFKAGVEQTTGFTISYTTGIVTWLVAPASGALTWTGEFDVPVRFDTDHLNTEIQFYDVERWPDIPLIEVRV